MYDPYVSHEMTSRLVAASQWHGLVEGDLLLASHNVFAGRIIQKLRLRKPASSFRSKYAYDNLLHGAGQIIPAGTGTSWDDYIRTRIFAPLAMKSSTVITSSFKPDDNVAFPHSKIDGTLKVVPFQNLDNVGPAGAINSSAAEMSRWLLLQLNHGKFADRDERLFSEKQSKEMWAGQTILPIGTPPASLASLKANFAAYALG
jgi:CubicO group peptidase (beta-lactamase class C family)